MSAPFVLHVDSVSIERGGRRVLSEVSFGLPQGAALTVTGNNGVGKSTLLRAMAGLLPLAGGRVRLKGDGFDPDTPVMEQAHYLGHADGLKTALTALENLRFAAAWGRRPRTRPEEALGLLGLAHTADLPVAFLSAGQRRRVALARLLVSARPLWLLDEPATALDRSSEAVLAGVMRGHLDGGGMIVAAIHAPLDVPSRELRLASP